MEKASKNINDPEISQFDVNQSRIEDHREDHTFMEAEQERPIRAAATTATERITQSRNEDLEEEGNMADVDMTDRSEKDAGPTYTPPILEQREPRDNRKRKANNIPETQGKGKVMVVEGNERTGDKRIDNMPPPPPIPPKPSTSRASQQTPAEHVRVGEVRMESDAIIDTIKIYIRIREEARKKGCKEEVIRYDNMVKDMVKRKEEAIAKELGIEKTPINKVKRKEIETTERNRENRTPTTNTREENNKINRARKKKNKGKKKGQSVERPREDMNIVTYNSKERETTKGKEKERDSESIEEREKQPTPMKKGSG